MTPENDTSDSILY